MSEAALAEAHQMARSFEPFAAFVDEQFRSRSWATHDGDDNRKRTAVE